MIRRIDGDARFYFDVRDGNDFRPDDDGLESIL
jgi:hypothetical protein